MEVSNRLLRLEVVSTPDSTLTLHYTHSRNPKPEPQVNSKNVPRPMVLGSSVAKKL